MYGMRSYSSSCVTKVVGKEGVSGLNLNGTFGSDGLQGRVQYTHALDLDAPIFVQKIGAGGAGFVPQASWRGAYEDGTNLNGSEMGDFTWPSRQPGSLYGARRTGRHADLCERVVGKLLEGRIDANGVGV